MAMRPSRWRGDQVTHGGELVPGYGGQAFKGGTQEMGHFGQLQSALTTIELGFAPFIPFTKQYVMAAGGMDPSFDNVTSTFTNQKTPNWRQMSAGSAWSLIPQDGEKDLTGDWANDLALWEFAYEWQNQFGKGGTTDINSLLDGMESLRGRKSGFQIAADNAPHSDMAIKSAMIASELSRVLDKTDPTPSRTGESPEEIQTAELTRSISSVLNAQAKEELSTYSSTMATGNWGSKGGGGFSTKGIDLSVQNSTSRDLLAFTQMTLDSAFETNLFRNTLGIETTSLSTSKYFQRNFDMEANAADDRQLMFQQQILSDMAEIESMLQTGPLVNVYETLKDTMAVTKTSQEAGHDTLAYTAQQMADRIRRIEAAILDNAPYDGFIWQMPVSKFEVGYIVIKPTIRDGYLESIGATPFLMDVRDIESWPILPLLGLDTTFTKGQNAAVPDLVGTHVNMLLLQSLFDQVGNSQEITALANQLFSTSINLGSPLNEGRYDSQGNIMIQDFGITQDGIVGNLGYTAGMSILSSQRAADIIRDQIVRHVEGYGSALDNILRDAYVSANQMTSRWKQTLGTTFPSTDTVFGPPYLGNERDLEGIGLPFWATIGRDPFAFKAFMTGKQTKYKPVSTNRLIHRTERSKGAGVMVMEGYEDAVSRGASIVDIMQATDIWRKYA